MSSSTRTDSNSYSFTGLVTIEDRHFGGVVGYADVLKFSAADAAILGHCSATGGRENACDANNNSEVAVHGTLALIGGEQAALVVKGGSTFRTGASGLILITPSRHAKTDLLVDDWSDQSQQPSTVVGDFRRADGRPVRVVFGRWRRPQIDGPSEVVWLWTIGLHLYNPLKSLVRWALRIPVGVKGPAWL